MAGNLQPLDEKFPIVDEFGKPTLYFIKWAQQRQIDITDALTLLGLEEYLAAHPLQAGSGIQITPSGNLAESPTIAADVQEILDQVAGSVQGAILYRNASDWVTLAPGVAGQFLRTNGAGADPVWAAAGGGSSYERGRVPPVLANFTWRNQGGASAADTISGIEFVGTSGGANIRFLKQNAALPATPYSVIMRAQPYRSTNGSSYFTSLVLRNSVNGRLQIFGIFNGTQILVQNWSAYATFNSNVLAPVTYATISSTPWFKLENDGTNLRWYMSCDGISWFNFASTTIAAYLGGVDEIGFGCMDNGTTTFSKFQSWEIV